MMLAFLVSIVDAQTPSPQESLSSALTIEGLLFAAFAFAVRFSEPSPKGRSAFFAQGWFGWLFVLAITATAVSAGASWWAAYEPTSLTGVNLWLRAGGLVLGIVGPPVFAAIINWQAKRQ